jgi:hypothetical protein
MICRTIKGGKNKVRKRTRLKLNGFSLFLLNLNALKIRSEVEF